VWPLVFLIGVTLLVLLARQTLIPRHAHGVQVPAHHVSVARYYRVRPGDTLTGVAAKTGVPMARLLHLNPNLQPTALFIGERIRLQ